MKRRIKIICSPISYLHFTPTILKRRATLPDTTCLSPMEEEDVRAEVEVAIDTIIIAMRNESNDCRHPAVSKEDQDIAKAIAQQRKEAVSKSGGPSGKK